MKSPLLRRALLCLSAAAIISCSQSAPRIDSVSLRLTYRADGAERLSFFALAADDDGLLDLEELHLLNDRAQLYWTLRSDDWLEVDRSGETWVGSHSIAMPDDAGFPRGIYRAVLVDKGGSRAERTVSFEAPAKSARPFPLLSIASGRYRAVSAYPSNTIVAYDQTGSRVKTVALKRLEGPLTDLALPGAAASIALWAEDGESGVGAITDAVRFGSP